MMSFIDQSGLASDEERAASEAGANARRPSARCISADGRRGRRPSRRDRSRGRDRPRPFHALAAPQSPSGRLEPDPLCDVAVGAAGPDEPASCGDPPADRHVRERHHCSLAVRQADDAGLVVDIDQDLSATLVAHLAAVPHSYAEGAVLRIHSGHHPVGGEHLALAVSPGGLVALAGCGVVLAGLPHFTAPTRLPSTRAVSSRVRSAMSRRARMSR